MRKFRVTIHGNMNTWYAVEIKKWFGWRILGQYIDTYEQAQSYIANMQDSEK